MWLLIVLVMGSDTLDVSKDVLIQTPVKSFETEEECHDRLRILHKEMKCSSLIWDKRPDPDQLYLLSKNKYGMFKCIPSSKNP